MVVFPKSPDYPLTNALSIRTIVDIAGFTLTYCLTQGEHCDARPRSQSAGAKRVLLQRGIVPLLET
ncbi:MAG TPA: hypothetical protein DHW02_20415 [Ktedonobacter sp.]|nr:hypothetical protein [Ktedonobacter sp.]